jgi:hypothetical protein
MQVLPACSEDEQIMRACIAIVIAAAACGDSVPRRSLTSNAAATPERAAACHLTEYKCSRCHTIGRILAYDAVTREQWQPVVHRMRQMASSGITRDDADVVLQCLSSRR